MPVFVHLTPHRNVASIRRRGIALPRSRRGVYALPVTRSFYISHQWLRELRRTEGGTVVGIYFRLPDDEPVELGHYGKGGIRMTAAEAAGVMWAAEGRDPAAARAADAASKAVQRGRKLPSSPEGFEVIVPRRIAPEEIIRVKALPQVVGWRYRPGAHGTPPCVCFCCERGVPGKKKLLRKVEADEIAGRKPKAVIFSRPDASYRRVEREREARRKPED